MMFKKKRKKKWYFIEDFFQNCLHEDGQIDSYPKEYS